MMGRARGGWLTPEVLHVDLNTPRQPDDLSTGVYEGAVLTLADLQPEVWSSP